MNAERWWSIFKLVFKSASAYRLAVTSSLFARVVRLLGVLVIWYASLRSGSTLFSFQEIFTYYVIGEIFMITTTPHWSISSDIMRGTFSARRLKPMNILFYYWVADIGVDFMTHIFNLVLALAIAAIGFEFVSFPNSAMTYVLFVLSAVLGYLISLTINYIVGFLSFYTINVRGFAELVSQLQLFMSGRLFPLNLLPALNTLGYLPFAFTFYVPMQIYMEKMNANTAWTMIAVGLGWLAILVLIARVVYKKGLAKYEAANL